MGPAAAELSLLFAGPRELRDCEEPGSGVEVQGILRV